MLPGLYWLAGEKVRGRIDEGLGLLRSITKASDISFVDTKEVEQQGGHLALIQDDLARAMEEERYDEARRIKEEIKLMLLPSQQSQRAMEHVHVREMAQQLRQSVSRGEGVIAKLVQTSWHRSVLNCDDVQFVATTPEKFRPAARSSHVKGADFSRARAGSRSPSLSLLLLPINI